MNIFNSRLKSFLKCMYSYTRSGHSRAIVDAKNGRAAQSCCWESPKFKNRKFSTNAAKIRDALLGIIYRVSLI